MVRPTGNLAADVSDKAMRIEHETAPISGTVTETLAGFVVGRRDAPLPESVVREAKRLILQGAGMTLAASGHSGGRVLTAWAAAAAAGGRCASVLWSGATATSEDATLVNAALWYLLQLDPTHSSSGVKPVGQAAAAALAEGEVTRAGGGDVLAAMVLGIEVGLVITTSLQPSSYRDRGFTHMSLLGAVAAAVATCVLRGLSEQVTTNALGLAMITGGAGLGEQVGYLASALNSGTGARAGVVAAQLAEAGADAPPTAFDGEKGMLHAYSTETIEKTLETVASLGSHWRILELSYQRYRGDSTAPVLLDCVFGVLGQIAPERRSAVDELHFTVNPLTQWMAEERHARWGAPRTDLRATADMPFLVASAWLTGATDAGEKSPSVLTNPATLTLRDRVTFESDETLERRAARLEARFTDGTTVVTSVDAFHGSTLNPLSDDDIEQDFLAAATPHLSDAQAREIIDAAHALDRIERIDEFTRLLRLTG